MAKTGAKKERKPSPRKGTVETLASHVEKAKKALLADKPYDNYILVDENGDVEKHVAGSFLETHRRAIGKAIETGDSAEESRLRGYAVAPTLFLVGPLNGIRRYIQKDDGPSVDEHLAQFADNYFTFGRNDTADSYLQGGRPIEAYSALVQMHEDARAAKPKAKPSPRVTLEDVNLEAIARESGGLEKVERAHRPRKAGAKPKKEAQPKTLASKLDKLGEDEYLDVSKMEIEEGHYKKGARVKKGADLGTLVPIAGVRVVSRSREKFDEAMNLLGSAYHKYKAQYGKSGAAAEVADLLKRRTSRRVSPRPSPRRSPVAAAAPRRVSSVSPASRASSRSSRSSSESSEEEKPVERRPSSRAQALAAKLREKRPVR